MLQSAAWLSYTQVLQRNFVGNCHPNRLKVFFHPYFPSTCFALYTPSTSSFIYPFSLIFCLLSPLLPDTFLSLPITNITTDRRWLELLLSSRFPFLTEMTVVYVNNGSVYKPAGVNRYRAFHRRTRLTSNFSKSLEEQATKSESSDVWRIHCLKLQML